MLKKVTAILQRGHQVASGESADSPYPAGTIQMQIPFFKAQGLDLSSFYPATLNLSIQPAKFEIICADFCFRNVHWAEGFEAEDFSFVSCCLRYQQHSYQALIYYPHPETKKRHFQSASMIEVLAPKIPDITYGDVLILEYDDSKLTISNDG